MVPFLAVVGTGAGESPLVSGNAPPPLGVDAPRDEGPPADSDKGRAGDEAPGEGKAGVSKSILARSRIWSTSLCTCGSVDTLLVFSC